MKAVVLTTYGDPATGLVYRDLPEPEKPGGAQVLVGVELVSINFSDILVARGLLPLHPELPSVIGNGGVGRVLEVGNEVSSVKVGDWVALPLGSFTWRERMVVRAAGLVVLPDAADPRQLSMLSINPPTPDLLLESFVQLHQDDWIAINAANSAIARWLISLAKRKGVKTLGLVRRAEVMDEVRAVGCDLVLLDEEDARREATKTLDHQRIRLALDAIAGDATGRLAKLLGDRGTLVVYSAASFSAIAISPFEVILRDLTIRGFSIFNPAYAKRIAPAILKAASMITAGEVTIPIAGTYPLEEIGAAIAHVARGGKVLLEVGGAQG